MKTKELRKKLAFGSNRKRHRPKNRRTKLSAVDLRSDPEIQALAAKWDSLDAYQRGDRIVLLLKKYSERDLAVALNRSATGIRNFSLLGQLSLGDRWKAKELGIKKVLETIR